MTAELVSKAEFGRRQKLSPTRVKQLVADGMPIEGTKVPVRKAEAWLKKNLDERRRGQWASGGSLNDLRRKREAIRVQQDQLELDRARGALIAREGVKRFLADRAKLERDSWVAFVSRTSARVAAEIGADPGALFIALEREVRDQLRVLSETPLRGLDDDRRVA